MRYYFIFGEDDTKFSKHFPYPDGWVEVVAASIDEAFRKFRTQYPDVYEGILNCSMFYDESGWASMFPEKRWPNWSCQKVIA